MDFVTSHGIHIFGSSRFQLKLKQIINEINIENHIVLSQTSRLYFAFSISSHPLFALILKQCEKYTAKYFAKYTCLSVSLSPLLALFVNSLRKVLQRLKQPRRRRNALSPMHNSRRESLHREHFQQIHYVWSLHFKHN